MGTDMHRRTTVQWALGLLAWPAAAQNALPDAFAASLRRHRLEFTPPGPCFAATPVGTSQHMAYEYALRCAKADVEVRYAIRSAGPRERPERTFTSVFLNVSREPSPRIIPFEPGMKIPEDAIAVTGTVQPGSKVDLPIGSIYVKGFVDPAFEPYRRLAQDDVARFRAEWAAGSLPFVPRPDFSKTYTRGLMLMLHVAGRADAFVFMLFNNDSEPTRQALAEAFVSLKFR